MQDWTEKREIWTRSPSGGRLQVIPVTVGNIHALLLLQPWRLFWDRTACPARGNRLLPEPGRPSTCLSTRRAGVHVDFHAHRHFYNLRSFPTHQGFSQAVLA